jgi:hypothetical protein
MHRRPLAVGDMTHEFAYGFFGRDHYDCMQVVETGPDWVLLRSAGKGKDSYTVRIEGFEQLVKLMKVRDEQIEEGCTKANNYLRYQDGDGCDFQNSVQLTESGPFVSPPRHLR